MKDNTTEDYQVCLDGLCPRKDSCPYYQRALWLIAIDQADDRHYAAIPPGTCHFKRTSNRDVYRLRNG